jgi:hypothetical protein
VEHNTGCTVAASIVAPDPRKPSFRHPFMESSCDLRIVLNSNKKYPD